MIDTSKKTNKLDGVLFAVDKGPEKIYYCNACGGFHHSKEKVAECRNNRNAIIKHNTKYRMKHGTISKDKDSVFQFSSWLSKSKANRQGGRAFYDSEHDRIYVDISRYKSIESLVNAIVHESIHQNLHKLEGLEASWLLDGAALRLLYDTGGYLGFKVFNGEKHYRMIFETELKIRKWLQTLKENKKI
jgi:hypothetical protein